MTLVKSSIPYGDRSHVAEVEPLGARSRGDSLDGNFSVTTVGPTQADKIKDDVATPARNRHLFECWAGFGSGSVGAVAGAVRVVTRITYNDLSLSGCTLWTKRDEHCLKRALGRHVSGQMC